MERNVCNLIRYLGYIYFYDSYSLFILISFFPKFYLAKQCPKLGIKFPNSGYDNQKFHILMVILNQIQPLWITKYILYSITLFYRNESISMALQGCAIYSDIWYRPYLWPNCLESYLNKLQVYSMSTSIYTRTPFKNLLMSQFPREPLTYKKSKRKLIIFFTRAPPLESPFLC